MADNVRKINYCYIKVPNRPGQGIKILEELKQNGVQLYAYSGFPSKGGKSQIDLIPEDMAALKKVARKNSWRLSKVKKGFIITGNDKLGAVHRHVAKLADAKINITAADAIIAGKGRYGMSLWVKPASYSRAARVLRAK